MRKLEEDKVSCWIGVGFLVSLHLPTCGGTDNIHPFIHALCLVVVVMYVGVGDIYHQVYIGPTWYGASSASLFITAAKDSGNARRRPPFLHQWRRRRRRRGLSLVWRTADSRNPPPFPRGNARLQRQKQRQHRSSHNR